MGTAQNSCAGFFFFFVVLWFELRVFTLGHSTRPVLYWVFVELESHELFAQAGL
jgi:hypothetical protein